MIKRASQEGGGGGPTPPTRKLAEMEQKRQEDTTESDNSHILQRCDAEEHKTNKKQTLRVLEFYSGIGGMRYSLLQSGVAATVVQAFDMNQVANRVYSHNFGEEPSSKAIEHLTVEELIRYEADLYLLSPPCQPYTRAGLQRGNQDNRTNSLLHLLSLLQMLPASSRPTYLLLENVKGFEQSDTFQVLTQVLDYCNYAHQHFLLTPTQFGVPNQRLRYYCLAKAMHKGSFYDGAGQLIENLAGLLPPQPGNDYRGHASTCLPLSSFLEKGSDDQPSSCFAVPPSFFRSVGYRHDIVSPESMTSSCFTKGYGQNFWAAGPLLLSSTSCELSVNEIDFADTEFVCSLPLRFFTPREVANLLGFPSLFSFPADVTIKQRYRLLGNSLSITVVADLIKYLFQSPGTS